MITNNVTLRSIRPQIRQRPSPRLIEIRTSRDEVLANLQESSTGSARHQYSYNHYRLPLVDLLLNRVCIRSSKLSSVRRLLLLPLGTGLLESDRRPTLKPSENPEEPSELLQSSEEDDEIEYFFLRPPLFFVCALRPLGR